MKEVYKSSEAQRKAALDYYWAHRAEVLAKAIVVRRSHGIGPRRPVKTAAEKLAATPRMCKCGRQITTPSLVLRGSGICRSCRRTPRLRLKENQRYRRCVRAKVAAYKAASSCKQCGRKQGLEFHHRDPSTKVANVPRLASKAGWRATLAEIEKCDLLCKSCHEALHDGADWREREGR